MADGSTEIYGVSKYFPSYYRRNYDIKSEQRSLPPFKKPSVAIVSESVESPEVSKKADADSKKIKIFLPVKPRKQRKS